MPTISTINPQISLVNITTISNKAFRKNHEIRVDQVLLIDEKGQKCGVVATDKALQRALDAGLDLVEVAPLGNPPVAKIVNYGKLLYEQEKQERKNRAKTKKGGEIKGIRLSIKIAEHDLIVRANASKKFLDKGDKVKIELQLRGREQAHPELAHQLIERFIAILDRPTIIEQPIKRLGGRFSAIVSLKK